MYELRKKEVSAEPEIYKLNLRDQAATPGLTAQGKLSDYGRRFEKTLGDMRRGGNPDE